MPQVSRCTAPMPPRPPRSSVSTSSTYDHQAGQRATSSSTLHTLLMGGLDAPGTHQFVTTHVSYCINPDRSARNHAQAMAAGVIAAASHAGMAATQRAPRVVATARPSSAPNGEAQRMRQHIGGVGDRDLRILCAGAEHAQQRDAGDQRHPVAQGAGALVAAVPGMRGDQSPMPRTPRWMRPPKRTGRGRAILRRGSPARPRG